LKKNKIIILLFIIFSFYACGETPVPKPRGYFRIDLPEKEYVHFNDTGIRQHEYLPLTFEYPAYGEIAYEPDNMEQGWFNINIPVYNARIYLTYKPVQGDLASLIEQTYRMNVKNHITRADAINEELIYNTDKRVFGILYDLKGNTATAVQFFVTDSINHFLRGSLYFSSEPNPDSLAPVIDFFRQDIAHMIETLKWE
jgi:gliding motility-associated lipoprotein GldD